MKDFGMYFLILLIIGAIVVFGGEIVRDIIIFIAYVYQYAIYAFLGGVALIILSYVIIVPIVGHFKKV